jgi:hypothetical protein
MNKKLDGKLFLVFLFIVILSFDHFYASFKGTMSINSFMLVNEKTLTAHSAWNLVNDNWLIAIWYIALLLGSFFMLKKLNIKRIFKYIIYIVICLPGFWYSSMTMYLGNKLIRFF